MSALDKETYSQFQGRSGKLLTPVDNPHIGQLIVSNMFVYLDANETCRWASSIWRSVSLEVVNSVFKSWQASRANLGCLAFEALHLGLSSYSLFSTGSSWSL